MPPPLLLLGHTGYVGSAISRYLTRENVPFRGVSRKDHDYTNLDVLRNLLRETKPQFLINCAGYTGKPNVDACEDHKAECLAGNAVLPGTIRIACEEAGIPWGHVSSGCIYTGCRPDGSGFTELDKPNFSFRTDNCSFYSGTKALGEECLAGAENVYIWRLRIPFDSIDSSRNYLSKLMRYDRLLSAVNSITQLDEFARVCWQSFVQQIPFGIYNVTNTGHISTEEVVELIHAHLGVDKSFQFFASETEFMAKAARTPRSNCILDNSKLLATGIPISHVTDAVANALKNWRAEKLRQH